MKSIELLRRVYREAGNSAPANRRHALTPGLRDDIRDFLKGIGVSLSDKPSSDYQELPGSVIGYAHFPAATNSQTASDPPVLMPKRLTAENGAKALLSGEFSEKVETPVLADYSTNEPVETEIQNVPVSWTTIKAIYAKVVEHRDELLKAEGVNAPTE